MTDEELRKRKIKAAYSRKWRENHKEQNRDYMREYMRKYRQEAKEFAERKKRVQTELGIFK